MLAQVRSGAVSVVDEASYTARVVYADDGITSGWLKILRTPPRLTVEETTVAYRVEDAAVVGSTETASMHSHGVDITHGHPAVSEAHDHPITVQLWLPKVGYDVDVTYYTESAAAQSQEETARKVADAVDEFARWQSERMGRDINPSRLVSLLMGAGIKRVEVRAPVYTAVDGTSVALLGETKVLHGGTEDG